MPDAPYVFHYDPPSVAPAGVKEDTIQRQILSMLVQCAPGIAAFAVPNAGRRSAWEARQRKAEGMRPGVCDLILVWPRGVAFIEVKARDGRLDGDQVAFLNRMHRMGHCCGVFRSAATLLEALVGWGAPTLGRVAA